MIPTKDKSIDPRVIEALKAGKSLGEAQAAATDSDGEARAVDGSDEGGEYFDFIKEQQSEYKDLLAGNSLPEPNSALPKMPAPFEQVSLCAKGGGCRYLFEITAPVKAKIYDDSVGGGMRPAMATIRRCLVGAVKLESDDPIVVSTMKHLGTEAPYGVQKCSHWSPYLDDELAVVNERRLAGQRRDAEREALAALRAEDEARARRPPEGVTEDPADGLVAADEDLQEPDFSAPPKAFVPVGAVPKAPVSDIADGEPAPSDHDGTDR